MSARIQTVIYDNEGNAFDPNSLPKAYTYDANNNMTEIVCTLKDGSTRTKTMTYVAGGEGAWLLESESSWIVG